LSSVTCNKDECDWLVNVALLKKIVQVGNSDSSSVNAISSCIRSLRTMSKDNPEQVQRFLETETSPFAAIASGLTKGLTWKEDLLKPSLNMYFDAVADFVKYVVEHNDADKCTNILTMISDSLCSIISGRNTTVSSAMAASMDLFVRKLSSRPGSFSPEMLDTLKEGIFRCDVCGINPIVGKHWRCCECEDFDLCDRCHTKCTSFPHGHVSSHTMTVHDDGRIINCVVCGMAKLATSWFSCSVCHAHICTDCEKSSGKKQHCPDSSLQLVTSEQEPAVSFLKSIFQTMTKDYLDKDDPSEELKRLLQESEKKFNYVRGCLVSDDQNDADSKDPMDPDGCEQIQFLKLICLKLLQLAQCVDAGNITVNSLVPVLQSLHTVSVQLFTLTKDLSVLIPVLEMFTQVHDKISSVSEPEKNGKFVILFLLFEKALYESLSTMVTGDDVSTGSLSALVLKIMTPDVFGIIQRILNEECFNPDASPVPMAVDSEEKREVPPAQSLAALLNPALLSGSNKPVQNMTFEPLVSTEYSTQHPDLFEKYSEILTLCLLELSTISLKIIKPAGMYDMWKNTIVNALGIQSSKCIHNAVKNLAKMVCADDVVYRMIRDGRMLDTELKWLENQAHCTHNFTIPMSTSETSRAIDHLSVLTKLSTKREAVWKAYCVAHPTIYKLVYDILTSISTLSVDSIPAELVTALLGLLSAGISASDEKKKSGTEEKEEAKEKSTPTPETVQPSEAEKEFILFMEADTKKLNKFADLYVLHYADVSVRKKASVFLKRVWFLADTPESKKVLMDLFVDLLQKGPTVGTQSSEFMSELGHMFVVKGTAEEQSATEVVIQPKMLVSMLREQNRVLMEHPNASLYRHLGKLMQDQDKYLFEPRPCLCCNAASREYKSADLSSISNQMRATSTARFYRLKNTYIIQSISLSVQKRRGNSRSIKVVNIYVNTRRVADIIDLRDKWDLWKRVQSVHIAEGQDECIISFPRPVSAANLCLEVAELHEGDKRQTLRCPRCSNSVPDRHGVCSQCGENAYQCRNCRYIPYENFDAIFCPQCGTCRDCSFDATLSVNESFVPEPVESDEDLKKATESLGTHAKKATDALLRLYDLQTKTASYLYP